MTKVHTIIIYSHEIENTISIEIYVSNVNDGYWNIDTNQVVVSSQLYGQFRNCKTQLEQRKFFNALRKVSNFQLG
jgi:hypothetical protein